MHIDLNSDLGEGFGAWSLGDDDAMMPLITSANIACGFHAGDPAGLLRTCRAAAGSSVTIGAQVGYRDLVGFGRRFIDIAPDDLTADVLYQIGGLDALARAAGSSVRYVKPHGALYNTIVTNVQQAQAVVNAVVAFDRTLPVLGLPGSQFLHLAEAAGLRTVAEAFADRAYNADGTLVDRREPSAVLEHPPTVARRVLRLVTEGVLDAIDGTTIAVRADSVCVHGDTPAAVHLAAAVRAELAAAAVNVAPFVR